MAEIASWNGHTFTVSPTLIRGFTGLTIKGSSETEDKTSDSQKYVSRKNAKPSEVAMTAELNALTGCNVRSEAMAFISDARNGKKGYFYIGGEKLLPYQLMLTEASITDTVIAQNGKWVSCKVKLTMKQCEKYGTSSSGSGGGSSGGSYGGGSSKKTSTKTTSTSKSTLQKVVDTVKNTVKKVADTVKSKVSSISSAVKKINQVNSNISAAKKASSTTKKTSVASKISSVMKKFTSKKKK